MSKPKKKKLHDGQESCGNCGIPWTSHEGIERTCSKLMKACLAIKLIENLALTDLREKPTAGNPTALQPRLVADLCHRMCQGLLSTSQDA